MGPTGRRNSSPPPATPQGCPPRGPAFTFTPPLPSLPLPQGPHGWRILGGQRIRPSISAGSWGPKWAGETWPCSLLILFPPTGSPVSPFGRGIPSPPTPQPPLGGACPVPPPLLLPLHSPHAPCPTPSLGVPPVPLGVRGPPRCLVGAPVVRRCEFHVLLVCHLDSTPLAIII